MFLWVFCTFGICFAFCFRLPEFIKSRLPKFLEEMFACMFCTGFWSGLLGALFCFPLPTDWSGGLNLLGFSFAGASICYIIDALMMRIEKGTKDG